MGLKKLNTGYSALNYRRANRDKMFIAISEFAFFNKASQQEKDAAQASQKFTEQLRSQYQTQFNQAAGTQNFLANRLQDIFTQAQAGYGFSPAEKAALETRNTEQAAQQNQNQQVATNRIIQQQGGGGGTTSGAGAQLAAQSVAQANAQRAAGANNIELANAQQARATLNNTGSLLSGVGAQQASLAAGTGNTSVSSGDSSFNQVAAAFKPSNFWSNLAQGAVSGLAQGALGVATGGLSTLATRLGKLGKGALSNSDVMSG